MTAPSFQHPPTPPAIPGDFVSEPPRRNVGEVLMDALGNFVDTVVTAEFLEDIL